jgi:prepilin-type N-terminal cleavage/methylation domain-containing protein
MNEKKRPSVFFMNENGVSLIELLVVVAIIGILAVASIYSYLTMRPTKNLHADGRDLLSNIQTMKLEAVKRNTCVGLYFLPVVPPASGGSYRIFVDDGSGGGIACDAVWDNPVGGGVGAEPLLMSDVSVKESVALTMSPVPANAADQGNLFTAISFNQRSMVAARLAAGTGSVVLSDNGNPAQATLWLRIMVRNTGNAFIQTNTNAANPNNWKN